MSKGRGSNLGRANRRNKAKGLRIKQPASANRRRRMNKKELGNTARPLKGIHKLGRGKREVIIRSKRDFNLIEFQIDNS